MKTKFNGILTLLLALVVQISFAQQKTITGTVSDDSGPLPGVSVVIKGTTTGTETDFDGKYSIKVKSGDVLSFSYIGYQKVEMKVSASNVINVTMQLDNTVLDEVIVVAYGTTTKEAFTGSANVVGEKELANRTVTSPIAAIEGKATGVQFIAASGQPGSSPGIVVRGVGTLNGDTTQPLYIVDGIQFEGSLSSLNQDDIASLTVLKDAASTSLYGSRAANGVVIITTKSGKKGKLSVNVTSQYSAISRAINQYETVGPKKYYELMWEAYKNTIPGPNAAAQASAGIFSQLGYNPFNVPNDQIVDANGNINPSASVIYQSLNWLDVMERLGTRSNHSINLSAGGDNHSVFYSAGFLEEKGYVIESDYTRITNRLNADFNPLKGLNIGGSMYITVTDTHGPTNGGGTAIVNPFNWAIDLGPIYPLYIVDNDGVIVRNAAGEPQYDLGEGYPQYGIQTRPYNPGRHGVAELILNEDQTKQNLYGFRNYISYDIIEGLSLKLTYGRDVQDFIVKGYENEIVGDGAPTGRYAETRSRRIVQNFTQLLNYNKTFDDVHNLEVTLGHESYDRNFSTMGGIANTQTATGIYEFDNFAAGDNVSGNSTDHRIESYFARLNYNFDNKYYLSGSFRQDATSRFSSKVRTGNFYSVGASWRLDQEDFMENVTFVDRLKIRGSYGEVGNERVGGFYASQALYTIFPNAGAPGIFWSSTGNNLLTWENQRNWDIALEFTLFNNLLEGSVEYYEKESVDLLYNVPIPISEGLNNAPDNIGSIKNSGLELGLTGHLIKSSDFSWDLTVQASTLKNEITDILDPVDNGSKRWEVGRSRYDFYIYHYAGVDPGNGDALYYMFEDDLTNGTRVPVLNANGTQAVTNDWQAAGEAFTGDSSLPDVIGSVSNTFTYKQFSLDMLFTYGIGGKILDGGYSNFMHPGTYGENLHVDAGLAWRQPGDITNVPRLENGNPNQRVSGSTRFLTDASYIALRSANLNYTFGKEISSKLGVNNLRLFLSGENIFISAKRRGLNPQYNLAGTQGGNDYAPSKVVSLGLNVSF